MANKGQGKGNNSRRSNGSDGNGGSDRNFLSPSAGGLEKSNSYHRIHPQSSTETSGLGETITSGFSSQESLRSTQSANEKYGNSNTTHYSQTSQGNDHPDTRQMREKNQTPSIRYDNNISLYNDQNVKVAYQDETNFDELFSQANAQRNKTNKDVYPAGLKVGDLKWERRDSTKSHSSIGSFRSRSGSKKFLGISTASAWTKWSQARRASYRRRLQIPENTNPEPTERASTPIKKARKELIDSKFVHPDLEKHYISEDDINYIRRHRQQRYQTFNVIEKSKRKLRNQSHTEDIHLSPRDWRVLTLFWEHKLFGRARYIALFFGILSTLFVLVSVADVPWITYSTGK